MKFTLMGIPMLLSLAVVSPAFAAPPSWTVDKSKSEVGFGGSYTGSTFKGTFGIWTAEIKFDPADLPASTAKVTFQTASAQTGDATKDDALTQEEWLNPAEFPNAVFTSSQITSTGPNAYVAKGTLTLKGKTLPVSLPFTLSISGNTATMKGSTTVDRIAYEIGTESDGTGTFVSKDITISVNLVAAKTP